MADVNDEIVFYFHSNEAEYTSGMKQNDDHQTTSDVIEEDKEDDDGEENVFYFHSNRARCVSAVNKKHDQQTTSESIKDDILR